MPSPLLDPLLPLAATLHATPGSHALLLGAGASVASGMPSAWDVEQELVRRVATLRGVDAGDLGEDPHAWYQNAFGVAATYESLLEQLAPTQLERQRLLTEFFEPRSGADDPAEGREPTAGHRAVARLVAAGSIRVVITLNFDRLIEQALREVGVDPVVVASASDVAGLAPVRLVPALVIHLHGDYLTATTMRNTTAELAGYEPDIEAFVEQLLRDHGLVLVGWSAKYDPALRAVLTRSLTRQFTSYWVEPGRFSATAEHLRQLHGIVAVPASADAALGALADAVAALRDRAARHPLTTAVAVATAKRGLAGSTTAIGVHDLLRAELTTLAEHPALTLPLHPEPRQPASALRLQLVEASSTAAALVAATAYWGDHRTDTWWFGEVARFAHQRPGGGPTALLQLTRTCGRQLHCAAGLAAVASGRYDLLHRMLSAVTTDHYGTPLQVAEALGPEQGTWDELRDVLVHLSLGELALERAWEVFELLVLVERAASSPSAIRTAAALETALLELRHAQAVRDEADGTSDADAHDDADADLAHARSALGVAVTSIGRGLRGTRPHVRVVDAFGSEVGGYTPVVGRELLAEVEREGEEHPLVIAGFGGGTATGLRALLRLVCIQVGADGEAAAFGTLQHGGGAVPGYLWLDTAQTPDR